MALTWDIASLDESLMGIPVEKALQAGSDTLLSCDFHDCKTSTRFGSLSKLNKHRNGHLKPYECLAQDCNKTFSQQQSLNRHKLRFHEDNTNPGLYYHCIVDGCKYASSGPRRKSFARADQAKEHIKDFGHYGPHSSSDRKRRPGNELMETLTVRAFYEQWTFDDNSHSHRKLETVTFHSPETKLWHTDDTADIYLHDIDCNDLLASVAWECTLETCYYRILVPGDLKATVFKTSQGLQEHCRRAHDFQKATFQSPSPDEISRTAGLNSVDIHTLDDDIFSSSSFPPFENDLQTPIPQGNDEWLDQMHEGYASLIPFSMLGSGILQWPISTDNYDESATVPQSPRSDSYDKLSFGHIFNNAPPFHGIVSVMSIHEKIICDYPSCGRSFTRRSDMTRHKASVHQAVTPIACPLCQRQFRRKDKMTDHMRRVHHQREDTNSPGSISMYGEILLSCIAPENTMETKAREHGSVETKFNAPGIDENSTNPDDFFHTYTSPAGA